MIFAFGNPVYDYIETPFVKTEGRVLSGCSTNACLALSKLGEKTVLAGCVGEDFYADFVRDMKKYRIQFNIQKSEQTGGFGLVYDKTWDRELTVLGEAGEINLIPDELSEGDVVLLGPILGEVSLDLVTRIEGKRPGLIFLDPQGLIRRIRDGKIYMQSNPETEEIMGIVDFVKPNEHEARVMTGIDPRKEPVECANRLFEWNKKVVIITLAEQGSVIFNGRDFMKVPPFKTEVRDSTGAGDTYAAGFIYEYMRSGDLYRAGVFGSSVASVMIEHTGPDFPLTLELAAQRFEMIY